MGSIAENRAQLRAEFGELEDSFDRYAYLVELAGLLPAYSETLRTENYLVRGCQSHVWLHPYVKDGRFFFDADSDTLIIKGVLLLLQDLLNNQPVQDVGAIDLDILEDAGLREQFSDQRQKGIGTAIALLRAFARNCGCE